jgi:hypothetical protein
MVTLEHLMAFDYGEFWLWSRLMTLEFYYTRPGISTSFFFFFFFMFFLFAKVLFKEHESCI